ncbi:MarR family winged helix-turn-helix transcriptional regulator [Maridesulfovibrio bastinii]|uniref:MarR family winged helix-turn-helix transcriptional regulator n=1 Tax=Maridesulfovibrio bastinii TaxID=47157 RepID=UPI0003FB941E|nr:MarR family winged helix-turn-helix transcriptional regulator [Maridesulfovibrio bastinii]
MKYNFSDKFENSYDLAAFLRYASRLISRSCHHRSCNGLRGRGFIGNHSQGRVLKILKENGSMVQGDLLEIMDVRSSSLSELLSKLESKGLIKKERSETDRRSFIISTTNVADELMDDITSLDMEAAEKIFSCLNDDEKENLHNTLKKIVVSLQDESAYGKNCGHGHGGHGGGRHSGRRHHGCGHGKGKIDA